MKARFLCSAAALMEFALVHAPAVWAQEVPDTPQSEEKSPSTGLNDIVVTAQRTEQTLQKAALDIDVIGGDSLVQSGTTGVDQLPALSPSLSVSTNGSYNTFFLRGVGNTAVLALSDPAIAFSYDGIYLGRPSGAMGQFYDLDRVEVLKGPQGTLYGRNATGGAINVLPTRPKIGQRSGRADFSFGSYDTIKSEAALNVPIGDTAALRVAGSYSANDPYLEGGESSSKIWGGRVSFKADLAPQTSIYLSADYAHLGGTGAGFSYIGHPAYDPTLLDRPIGQRFNYIRSNVPLDQGLFSPAAQAYRVTVPAGSAGRTFDVLTQRPFLDNKYYGVMGEITHGTSLGDITAIASWRGQEIYSLGSTDYGVLNDEKDHQFSFELRLAKTGSAVDYTVGAFLFQETVSPLESVNRSFVYLQSDYEVRTKSYAGFGQLVWHATDRLRLVGALRYTKDQKRMDGQSVNLTLICVNPTGCPTLPLFQPVSGLDEIAFSIPPQPGVFPGSVPGSLIARNDIDVQRRLENQRLTYRASVEFDVGERSLLYASVQSGYRSGGFNLATGFETFDPETITAFTIGSKNRFFNNRVQFNVEAFYWKYKDQQFSHVGLDRAGVTNFFTENIGDMTIKGVEADVSVRVTPSFEINLGGQYLDTRYSSFTYQTPGGLNPPPNTPCAVSVSSDPGFYDVDCSGRPSYFSPKWVFTASANKAFDIGNGYELTLNGGTTYRSGSYVGFEYRPSQYARAHWNSTAAVGFGKVDGDWRLEAFIRNIENNRVPTIVMATVSDQAATTAPRIFGARASVKF